jgi:hypothetical protein
VTLSVAMGSSVLFIIFGCVCCLVVSGRSIRARHSARMIGRQVVRVDEMPYAREASHRRGELWDGPLRNDLTAAPVTAPPVEFTFASLLGRRELA